MGGKEQDRKNNNKKIRLMNQRFFRRKKGIDFFGVVVELWFFDNREKSVFCFSWFSIRWCPSFEIFFLFFFAVTLWFHVFFSSIFIFVVQVFFLLFYHNSSLLRIYLLFLGTWGDFLRWFRYLDFFFISKRDNHDVFVLFSYDFESAEEKKKGLDWFQVFFWLGEQKKFFEWFFSRNRWSKWPYDFHSVIFFVQV